VELFLLKRTFALAGRKDSFIDGKATSDSEFGQDNGHLAVNDPQIIIIIIIFFIMPKGSTTITNTAYNQ